jgi:hypothetical protein
VLATAGLSPDLLAMRILMAISAAAIGALGAAVIAGKQPPKPPAPVVRADAAHPFVVELFTSQGCSSCPPANDNVAKLADRPDVIALSFGVTYWDQLGWKDTFASPRYTDRQWTYARAMHRKNVFSPQVVVNGVGDVVGSRPGQIEGLMAKTVRKGGPAVRIDGDEVSVSAAAAPNAPADVWLVRYDPRTIQVPIRAGENTGRTLPHRNVVRELTRIGSWSGEAAIFKIQPKLALTEAILVQAPGGGPILAAAKG